MLRRLGEFILDILQIIVFAVAIFLFVYLLILQPHKIKGASMEPSFHDGEFLLTDKLSYRFGEPERGNVVVFKAPINDRDEFIKRIVGLPGDTIKIKAGKILLNGEILEETYLNLGVYTNSNRFAKEDIEVTVPEDEYFVLGDNRGHSSDSRFWGFIKRDAINGKAWLVYWPPGKAGIIKTPEYPMLGS